MNQDTSIEIFDLAGLPSGFLTLTKVEITQWGGTVISQFAYKEMLDEDEKEFLVQFGQCEQIIWECLTDESEQDEVLAEVIGFHFRKSDSLEWVTIVTRLAEINIKYRSLVLNKDW